MHKTMSGSVTYHELLFSIKYFDPERFLHENFEINLPIKCETNKGEDVTTN